MRYFLGIDGGGSKTIALVIDEEGRVHGMGLAKGSNHQGIGIGQALERIKSSIDSALSAAGLTTSDITHAVYGLAGADRERDLNILRPALASLPIASWRVVCDTMIGLRTGSPSNTGVVLICGSGTNAAGRNADGVEVQTGGFGYLYGDWGGGGDLAREAFRMAIRSYEKREAPSLLVESVPAFLGYADVESMYNDYLDRNLSNVPRDLSIVVHQTADAGDAVAASILSRMGRELGLAAHSVASRLPGLPDPFELVMVGSVIQKGRHPLVIEAVEEVLRANGWRYHMTIPEAPPVVGALWLALDDAGICLPHEWSAQFAKIG